VGGEAKKEITAGLKDVEVIAPGESKPQGRRRRAFSPLTEEQSAPSARNPRKPACQGLPKGGDLLKGERKDIHAGHAEQE